MFTLVASYIDPIEAHIARGRLLSEGIDARVDDGQVALANWEWRLAIGGTKLRVPSAQAELAREILRAMDAGDYRLEDDDDHGGGEAMLEAPDRESASSRLAWVALMLFSLPLPWRRRNVRDNEATRLL